MKKNGKTEMRSDTEILKDLIDAVMEYNSLRDEESDFAEENGSPDTWDKETGKRYEELVADVLRGRESVRKIIVEATGDEDTPF